MNSKYVSCNLKEYSKKIDALVLWLDCDREGESIAYEVIDICGQNCEEEAPFEIYRAHFSALTSQVIKGAMKNLMRPNPHLRDAVMVRQEIDLRIGASYTRFLTLTLQELAGVRMISYGPCQFPTLGFIVERHQFIRDFVPEAFWKINFRLANVEFLWGRK